MTPPIPVSVRRVLLGHIAGAHGIRGEVLIKSYTGEPEAIASYGPLTDAEGKRPLVLEVVGTTPKGVIARAAGISSRNAAEKLKGEALYVEHARLPQAEEGEYYHADLIGLSAVTPDGAALGVVVAVENFGAGDLLAIRLHGPQRTELIPFTKIFVPEIDAARNRIVVKMPAESAGDGGEPES